MSKMIEILAIPGSLRENSFNKALLNAAAELAPEDVNVELFELHDIPLYNADVEAAGLPEPVARFKETIDAADGLLIATPQYNGSISGVLKNAIDWASRPAYQSVLADKPVIVIGATPGKSMTSKAREDAERILESCRAIVVRDTRFGLSGAADYIEEGDVQSAEVREKLAEVLDALVSYIKTHSLVEASAAD